MSTPLLDQLRTATRDAHTALEDTLALLQPPLRRERFVHVLQGFLAFHRAWEPRIAAVMEDHVVLAPRSRIALIEQDLQALGSPSADATAKPFDLTFLTGAAEGWGSLYVMEGSTLGGRVISKAVRGSGWAPQGGLSYFDPYGQRTGAMWAAFRTDLDAAAPGLDAAAVVQGAQATFQTLQCGLARPLEASA